MWRKNWKNFGIDVVRYVACVQLPGYLVAPIRRCIENAEKPKPWFNALQCVT